MVIQVSAPPYRAADLYFALLLSSGPGLAWSLSFLSGNYLIVYWEVHLLQLFAEMFR